MLTQQEADRLLNLLKNLKKTTINFPRPNTELKLDVTSIDGKDTFSININRKGKLKPNKCTYLTIYEKSIILIRVDIEGPPHMNPNGVTIPCPHIHLYREGFEDRWAWPLHEEIKDDCSDIVSVLMAFFEYNKIVNIPYVKDSLF